MPFAATQMDLEITILSEVTQTEKNKYHITYMWNLIKISLFTQSNSKKSQNQIMVMKGET